MKVIIPAAGLGTRFVAEGFTSPKELLPLGGKPVIAHALDEARLAGFDSAVVVVSPAKESLRRYLIDGEHPLPVEIVIQPQPLGIGDAVLRGWQGEAVAVLLPDDVVVRTDHWIHLLEARHVTGGAALCVRPVPIETISRFGIAECAGDRVVRLLEKPSRGTTTSNLAIFGRYVVTEPVAAGLRALQPDGELELTFGFMAAITSGNEVRAIRFSGDIYDCGRPSDYAASVARFPG